MTAEMRAVDFFKAGGTLHQNAPSYITRPADTELFNKALAGQFCYVLTSRQRGKSSLMIRTAGRLRRAGVRVSIIDLSGLGTQVTQEQWYLGMIARIANDLRIRMDVEQWWREHGTGGPIQRFTDFLHDIVLRQSDDRVVVFLDEIDSTLKLDFTDDFFAAIRVMHNARASDPEYDRLTFVLLGVATPTDLVKDPKRTPFNIGQRIELPELSRADATPLEEGLGARFPERGAPILDRIFHWTNGHPYLTQRICLEVAEAPDGTMSDGEIDAIVDRLFLSEESRKKENNLNYVDSAIKAIAERRPIMKLYRRIFGGEQVAEDKRDPAQERLRLVGLIRAEDGVLHVRNRIYERVFDQPWIQQNTPRNSSKLVIMFAAMVVVLALALVAFSQYQTSQQQFATSLQTYGNGFANSSSTVVKLNNLALLCEKTSETAARDLFYGRQVGSLPATTAAQRVDLFNQIKDRSAQNDLKAALLCLQPNTQIPSAGERDQLLPAMQGAACRAGLKDDQPVRDALGGLACSAG